MKKVLGFWDLAFFAFCSIFGVEAIATTASIGPSAISWWLICILGFFLPFGLIAAELGATYPEQGGMYIWIKRAFGRKWAGRSIWFYWMSLPVWLPAIYIAIADILGHMFFPTVSIGGKILLGIVLIWCAVGINLCPLKVSKWIPNIGSMAQFIIVVSMIATAIVYWRKNGQLANETSLLKILPNPDAAIVFIPVIIYNLLGCELLSSAAGETKEPARDIPRALVFSAVVIAALYMITTFAFWVVIPTEKINIASGILQLFTVTFADHPALRLITLVAGFLISTAFFAGIIAWTLGQNRTVAEAANNGVLPKILGKMNKDMAPLGASVLSGIISTVVITIYGFIAQSAAELFWHTISFSLIVQLFAYMMLFPAYVVLKIRDHAVPRPYRVPGPPWFAIVLACLAETFILSAVVILLVQPGHDFVKTALPIIVGVLITVVVGEIFAARSR